MPLRVLKNRGFARAARKEGLSDGILRTAVAEIEAGLIDARLGGEKAHRTRWEGKAEGSGSLLHIANRSD